jgi:TldD protein
MIYKRREFIKLSGITTAGSMIIPPLFQSCRGASFSKDARNYLDHFEITEEQLQKVIITAMDKGADYADIFFEHTVNNTAMLQDNKVNRAYSDIKYGAGIRVLKGEQTGFAYSENTSSGSMLQAARTAANIAESSSSPSEVSISELIPPSYYKITTPWDQGSIHNKP